MKEVDKRIVLRAEVLGTALGCPVCGGQKTEKARTCKSCFQILGREVTAAVDEIAALTIAAVEAHKLANAGNVRREVVFGPVLAQVRINERAELKVPFQPAENIAQGPMGVLNSLAVGASKGIGAYLLMPKAVSGGLLNLYVFGATEADKGKEITALVELKTKLVKNGLVHYLRAEKVDAPVRSDVRLSIQRINDYAGYNAALPLTDIRDLIAKPGQTGRHTQPRERLIECSVGFKAVQEVTLPEGVTVNGEKQLRRL